MSSEITKYRAYIDRLGLTDEDAAKLIGALQQIAESKLDKKYMLRIAHHEDTTRQTF